MPSTEREHHPEDESRGYVQSAQFADADSAGHVYAALQQTIFETQSELSCFRLQINTSWHTVVLGELPPRELADQIETLLSLGEPATLPDEVLILCATFATDRAGYTALHSMRFLRQSRGAVD